LKEGNLKMKSIKLNVKLDVLNQKIIEASAIFKRLEVEYNLHKLSQSDDHTASIYLNSIKSNTIHMTNDEYYKKLPL